MLTYTYVARNSTTGEKTRATVQADSEQSATKLLKGQGLTPLSLKLDKANNAGLLNRVKSKDRVLFSRQLATLINAGLPLIQSLRSVAQQTSSKPMRVVINQVITDVEAGTAFSVAISRHPKAFDRLYVSLIAAGETSGTLDKALERIADQQEKDADILSKVRGAMIYPAIVLVVMAAVVGFMVVKVMPQVKSIYQGLPGVSLPLPTRMMLGLSSFVTHFWWVVIIIVVLLVFGFSRYSKSVAGRKVVDTVKMKAWPFGQLFMKMYMARFARTGSTLVASGVPLLQMMEIAGDAVDNVNIKKSLQQAAEKVRGGKSLADALANDHNFLDLIPSMIKIGEQSGSLETMMDKAATYYEKEVDNEIKNISTIIEPVLMIVMGVVALTIVAAVLLPIYGLVSQSSFTNSLST